MPRGFTVIELIVVLAIISLIIGSTVPLFSKFQSGQRFKGTVADLSAALRTAQSRATAYRKPHSVVLDVESEEYWIEEEDALYDRRKRLAKGVEIEEVTGSTMEGSVARLTFSTNGSVVRTGEGPILIKLKSAKGREGVLAVNPLTGSVKLE